jgi:hypothetical protein
MLTNRLALAPFAVRAANDAPTVLPSVITADGLDIHRYICSALVGSAVMLPYAVVRNSLSW